MRSFRTLALTALSMALALAYLGGTTVTAQDTVDKETRAKEYFNEGLKYAQEGRITDAIRAYEGAITVKDDYIDAYLNLGALLFQTEAYDRALSQLQTAASKAPGNIEILTSLGRVQYALKDYDAAITTYEKAAGLSPDDPALLKEMGKAYYVSGKPNKYDKVIETLVKCHSKGAADHVTWCMLGKAYENKKDTAQAMQALQQSIDLDPKYYDSRFALGKILLGQEKYRSAAAQFKAALEAKPDRFQAAYNYAVAMENADPGAVDTNIANWENFIRLAKNNPRARNDVNVATEHVKELKAHKATTKDEF